MKLSRERAIFLGILAVALCGLIVDRGLNGSGPRQAEASLLLAQPELPLQSFQPAEADSTLVLLTTEPSGLARQLQTLRRKLDSSSAVPDAFLAGWVVASSSPAGAEAASVSAITSGYRLTAVLAQEGRGYAVINGQVVGLGQNIGGYRLIGLTPRSAVLQDPGGRELVLTLAEEPVRRAFPSR